LILFWLAAAVMSGAAAVLMLRAAARARAPGEAAGVRAALTLCLAAPLLAAVLYLGLGSPGAPDQAHAARVDAWRRAPDRIGPEQAAAVLETITRERPSDPEAYVQLGRARLAAGDAFGAVRAFERATALKPDDPGAWTALGRALLALERPAVPEARRALARARKLAPGDADPRYWLARAALADGDAAGALAQWRALAAELPAADPRRAALEMEIAQAEGAAAPVEAAIAGMVEGLAARLREQPDDAQGWARLARAYAVLGREAELQAALAEARRRFADRPEALRAVEAGAAEGRARAPLRAGG